MFILEEDIMKKKLLKGISVACCITLVAGLAGCSNNPEPTQEELARYAEEGLSFVSYAYPVMPLTTMEAHDGLEAERDVTFNMTNCDDGWGYITEVRDRYVITNTSEEEVTATLCYPYVTTLNGLSQEQFVYEMTVDDKPVENKLYTEFRTNRMNSGGVHSFAELKSLLEDVDPLTYTVAGWEEESQIPVTVYKVRCDVEEDDSATELQMDIFYHNPDQAKLLLDSMHGWGSYDSEQFISFGVWAEDFDKDEDITIISIGGQLDSFRGEYLFTYADKSESETMECDVSIASQQTITLEQLLEQYGSEMYEYVNDYEGSEIEKEVSQEEFCQFLKTSLAEFAAQDYDSGYDVESIDSIALQTINDWRFCYLTEEVTIPAGGKTVVSVTQDKPASFNYSFGGRKERNESDWFGFEIASTLGSKLTFTDLRADINYQQEVIVLADNIFPDDYRSLSLDEELYYVYYLTEDGMKRQITPPGAAAKPVIYLYPEEKTEVTVKLDLEGELTSTWPKYDEATGWQVTASPDGTLIDKDGYEYSYLFWEGELEQELDFSKGFVVSGEDSAEFLRDKLSYMGLTPTEYNEFIVYWAPILEQNPYNLISFQWENYQDAAKLQIVPEPDNMLRVYMAYQPLDEPVAVEAQELPVLDRSGFTVVEWGGRLIP